MKQHYSATREELQRLRQEAGEAGDTDQVVLCDRALAGDEAAHSECTRVLSEAAALAEDG